jgi:SNF2 family DNA or RNA helicase
MRVVSEKGDFFIMIASYEERYKAKDLGGIWSRSIKCWKLHNTLSVYKSLKASGVDILDSIRVKYDAMLEDYDKVFSSDDGVCFKTTPYQHQIKLRDLVLDRKQCFFFCGVGTGKSKAVIDAVTVLTQQDKIAKVLVVCPSSIMKNFQNEIETHSHFSSLIVDGSIDKRKKLLAQDSPIHIINYEILCKLKDEIRAKRFDMVIFDECHRLKNRTAKCSKAAVFISKNIPYRVGMSGTIIANSYEDIFMPYKIISPSIFGASFAPFKNLYLEYGGYNNYQLIGYKNEDQLKKLMSLNSLSYDIDDVIELPDQYELVKSFDLSFKSRKVYDTLVQDFVLEHNDEVTMTGHVLSRMMMLSQITSGFIKQGDDIDVIGDEKLQLLSETIQEIDGKMIIWCRFIHSIKSVALLCKNLGLTYNVHYGEVKDDYNKFNNDETQVWIGQIQTGIGYSLPRAKHAIFYETDYSHINHVQAKGRNRRLVGSDSGKCVYIYLQARNTLDEMVYSALKDKDFTARDAMAYIKGSS